MTAQCQPTIASLNDRLRAMPSSLNDACRTMEEAAVRIAELEGLLAPFAEIARELSDSLKDSDKNTMHWAVPTVGNLRAALAVLNPAPEVTND